MPSTPVGSQKHDNSGRTVGGSVEQGSASKSGASAKGTGVGVSPSATPQGNAKSIDNEEVNSAGSGDEDDSEEFSRAESELVRYTPRAKGFQPAASSKKTRKTKSSAEQTPQGQQPETPQTAEGQESQTPKTAEGQKSQTPQTAGGQKSQASGSTKRRAPAITASTPTTKGSGS